jgi:tryptophan synthase beta chain
MTPRMLYYHGGIEVEREQSRLARMNGDFQAGQVWGPPIGKIGEVLHPVRDHASLRDWFDHPILGEHRVLIVHFTQLTDIASASAEWGREKLASTICVLATGGEPPDAMNEAAVALQSNGAPLAVVLRIGLDKAIGDPAWTNMTRALLSSTTLDASKEIVARWIAVLNGENSPVGAGFQVRRPRDVGRALEILLEIVPAIDQCSSDTEREHLERRARAMEFWRRPLSDLNLQEAETVIGSYCKTDKVNCDTGEVLPLVNAAFTSSSSVDLTLARRAYAALRSGDAMHWINLIPTLASKYGSEPATNALKPLDGADNRVSGLLSAECRQIESMLGTYGLDPRIGVPEPVLEEYRAYRSTPLVRAARWETAIRSKAEIWIKREDLTPSGSHKYNTAVAQAYYAKRAGAKEIVADTGAGQWGLALAIACAKFDLSCTIFMPRHSFRAKEYRRRLMELAGASVHESPSAVTEIGRQIQLRSVGDLGRLSEAMSEAYEYAGAAPGRVLGQGCLSLYAPLHQSVIGSEVKEQCLALGWKPDALFACAGGGTNAVGFMAPYIEESLIPGNAVLPMTVVESKEIAPLTAGRYEYDAPDSEGLGAKLMMYSVGAKGALKDIGTAGLRYHAKSPLLSFLVNKRLIVPEAVLETEAKAVGREFTRAEGICPAPETAHALAAVRKFATSGGSSTKRVVVCFSGSGVLDAPFYAA